MLFQITLISLTLFFIVPHHLIKHWNRWGNFTDAIGLAAFAIQGAMHAVRLELPLSAVIVSAILTGCGGGIVRDLLAGRKPLVLRDEIYALWAAIAGLIIGLQCPTANDGFLYFLFGIILFFRYLSYSREWQLPRKKLYISK